MKVIKASTIGIFVLVFLTAILLWVTLWRTLITQVTVAEVTCYFQEPEFELRWIHSVEKEWWEEQYQRHDDHLVLTTTYLKAFGAGTPSTETFANVQKPDYIGYQINETLPELNWIVSRRTKGELNYGQQHLLIYQWAEDYSEVNISPQSYSLMDKLRTPQCQDIP